MADRKQTPDVLAQVLGAEDASPSLPLGSAAFRPVEQGPDHWKVEIVTCQEARGWRPRYVGGKELPRWMDGPLVQDYVGSRGADGWELAAATTMGKLFGAADGLQLWFKRRT